MLPNVEQHALMKAILPEMQERTWKRFVRYCMRFAVLIWVAVASGSAPANAAEWIERPGTYADFQDWLTKVAALGIKKGVPDMPGDVRQSFAQCLARATVTPLPSETRDPLDAAARGERAVPEGKTMLVQAVMMVKIKDSRAGKFDWAESYCPGDISDFGMYLTAQ